jgi:hypothetical protein
LALGHEELLELAHGMFNRRTCVLEIPDANHRPLAKLVDEHREIRAARLVLEVAKTDQLALCENVYRLRPNPSGANIRFELIGRIE